MMNVPDHWRGDEQHFPSSLADALTPKAISYPSDYHIHVVSDQELNTMLKAGSPHHVHVALMATGVALPSIPGALPALRSLWGGEAFPWESGCWLIVFIIAVVIAGSCWIEGFRRKSDLTALVQEIRNRKTVPITPSPHQSEA